MYPILICTKSFNPSASHFCSNFTTLSSSDWDSLKHGSKKIQ